MTDYVVTVRKDNSCWIAEITYSGRGTAPQEAIDNLNAAINASIGMLHKTVIVPD